MRVHLALDRIESYVAGLTGRRRPGMPADALAALGHVLGLPGERRRMPRRRSGPPRQRPVPAPRRTRPPLRPPRRPRRPPRTAPSRPRAAPPSCGYRRRPWRPWPGRATTSPAPWRAKRMRPTARAPARARPRSARRRRGARRRGGSRSGRVARPGGPSQHRRPRGGGSARRRVARRARIEGAADRRPRRRRAPRPGAGRDGLRPRSPAPLRETAREQGARGRSRLRGLDLPVRARHAPGAEGPAAPRPAQRPQPRLAVRRSRRAAGKPEALVLGLEVAVRAPGLQVTCPMTARGRTSTRIEATARARTARPGDARRPGDACCASCSSPASPPRRRRYPVGARLRPLGGRRRGPPAPWAASALEPRTPVGTALIFGLPLSAARRSLLLVEAGRAHYRAAGGRRGAPAAPGAATGLPVAMGRRSCGSATGDAATRIRSTDLAALLGQTVDPRCRSRADADRRGVCGRAGPPRALRRPAARCPRAAGPARTGLRSRPGLVAGTTILNGVCRCWCSTPRGSQRACAGPKTRPERWGRGPTFDDSRPAAAAARATILVVDDSITTRTLEKTILEAPATVWSSRVDGQDALDGCVPRSSPRPRARRRGDAHGSTGSACSRPCGPIRAFARLPTVLMTSARCRPMSPRGLDLGARAYLTKQKFDQRQLLDTIGQLLP